MLGALVAAAVLCAVSAVVGETAARILGLERWCGWSPVVGIAVLLVVATVAVEWPGHGTTAVVVIALLVLGAVVSVLAGSPRPSPEWPVVAVTLIVALAACVPYLSNGRFGILGVSFNNDLSFHLRWAEAPEDPGLPGADAPEAGYPLGVHALTAVVSRSLGVEVVQAMAALLLSTLVLLAWAALPLLRGLSRARTAVAAVLVALAYSVSAFYGQANFKELLLTLFLVAGVGIARAEASKADGQGIRVGIQLGLLGAAIVFAVSYAGLVWPALTAAIWATAVSSVAIASASGDLHARVSIGIARLRPSAAAALATMVTSALLIMLDASRVADSWQLLGFSPTSVGALEGVETGNVPGPVPKREVLGIWPREDFRLDAELSQLGSMASWLALVLAFASIVWWLRRRDFAVPAAAAASLALLVYLGWSESAYIASKALPPAGAFVMLLAVRPLLTPWRIGLPRRVSSVAQVVVMVAFAVGALWSSYLALRGAQVGPSAHAAELAKLSELVRGKRVLFLGEDDFARLELHGGHVLLPPAHRPGKVWRYGDPRDFDSSPPAALDSAEYVLTPRTSYRSEVPANLERVKATDSYDLWERHGLTPPRRILGERDAPGAVLDCSRNDGLAVARHTGWARVWTDKPRVVSLPSAAGTVRAGGTVPLAIELAPGRWSLSIAYTSPQEVTVAARERSWVKALPANLDRPGPFWPAGELRVARRGPLHLRVEVANSPLDARSHVAQILAVAAVRVGMRKELVPLSEACGRYVDWYTLGQRRPPVP